MKTKLLRTFTLAASLSAILISLVALNWPKPEPCVLTVRPIEAHFILATSLMQNGDTINMVRDGKKHYWSGPVTIPERITNAHFNLPVHMCSGVDESYCDIVMPPSEPIYITPSR